MIGTSSPITINNCKKKFKYMLKHLHFTWGQIVKMSEIFEQKKVFNWQETYLFQLMKNIFWPKMKTVQVKQSFWLSLRLPGGVSPSFHSSIPICLFVPDFLTPPPSKILDEMTFFSLLIQSEISQWTKNDWEQKKILSSADRLPQWRAGKKFADYRSFISLSVYS